MKNNEAYTLKIERKILVWCKLLWNACLQGSTQTHSIVKTGRNLWRLSSAIPLLKQDQLKQAAQGHGQLGFDTSKDEGSTTSVGNLCSVSLTIK